MDIDNDLGLGLSWCLEADLLTSCPRLVTLDSMLAGTEAVETSLNWEDTMEAVSMSLAPSLNAMLDWD